MNLLIVENNFLLKENFFFQSDLKINLVFSTSVKSVKKILNKKKFDFIIISSLAINLNSFHVITNIFKTKPKDKIIQILEKSNDIKHSFYHSTSTQYLKGSLDKEGQVSGWLHRAAFPSIVSSFKPLSDYASGFELGQGFINNPYQIENFRFENAKFYLL